MKEFSAGKASERRPKSPLEFFEQVKRDEGTCFLCHGEARKGDSGIIFNENTGLGSILLLVLACDEHAPMLNSFIRNIKGHIDVNLKDWTETWVEYEGE